jgi:hypothetical protein
MVYTQGDTRKNAFRENVDCFALFMWKRKKKGKGKKKKMVVRFNGPREYVSCDLTKRLGRIGDRAGKGRDRSLRLAKLLKESGMK